MEWKLDKGEEPRRRTTVGTMNEKLEHSPALDIRGSVSANTPLKDFIIHNIEPIRRDQNTWGPGKSHAKLLLDAGRRRKWRPQRIGSTYVLSHGDTQEAGVLGNLTTLVSHQAVRATEKRELTRQYLRVSGVPSSEGKTLHLSQPKTARAFLERLGRPVSVSPSFGTLQKGTSVNISTVDELERAWETASLALADSPSANQFVEVEAFHPWLPLRLYVVAESVVAAVARVPLYITGDGKHTLDELALAELQLRESCEYLPALEEQDKAAVLGSLGEERKRVLAKGHIRTLTHERGGQQAMGWTLDVTDQIGRDISALAVNAIWAFPGLGASAVDILSSSLHTGRAAVVHRVVPKADLREFRYPAYGKPQFPHRAIIERIGSQKRA